MFIVGIKMHEYWTKNNIFLCIFFYYPQNNNQDKIV
jgi:hypothetical protein